MMMRVSHRLNYNKQKAEERKMSSVKKSILAVLSLALILSQQSLASEAGSCAGPAGGLLFTSLNHISRECRDIEVMADFYQSLLGFERIQNPNFPFNTMWIKHPSGLVMHLIQGTEEFRLAEGSARNAQTGERVSKAFTQGGLDPNHIRRGHHLAFNINDADALKAELVERGIPYGQAQVPGSGLIQLFWYDVEGNGLEALYDPTNDSVSTASASTP